MKEPLKNWLWKYPIVYDGRCPAGCKLKIINHSACDELGKCKHGYFQLSCAVEIKPSARISLDNFMKIDPKIVKQINRIEEKLDKLLKYE